MQLKLNDLDGRVMRLERSMANEVAVSQHVDEMQASLRELQGRIEELEHSNEALTKQQRTWTNGWAATVRFREPQRGRCRRRCRRGRRGWRRCCGRGAGNNAPSSTEQAVYAQAFDALKAGSYSTAITGFKDFLGTYPQSSLADSAQYWLGEAYYVSNDYDAAGGAFRAVLKKWPDSRKAPDALLKLGYTQYAQKQYPAAKATLTDVTKKYPGTDTAKLAADRLKRIPEQ